jgi:hypothetical protein
MILISTNCFHDGVTADNIQQRCRPCRERTAADAPDPCPTKIEGPLYTLKYGFKRPYRQIVSSAGSKLNECYCIKISVLVQVKVRHDCIIVSGERSVSKFHSCSLSWTMTTTIDNIALQDFSSTECTINDDFATSTSYKEYCYNLLSLVAVATSVAAVWLEGGLLVSILAGMCTFLGPVAALQQHRLTDLERE